MAKNIIAKTCVIIGLLLVQLFILACCGIARGGFLAMIGIALIPSAGIVRMRIATVREVLFKSLGQFVLCAAYGLAATACAASGSPIGVQFVLGLIVIVIAAMIWFIRPEGATKEEQALIKKDSK